jgi:hypothetical protein
VDGDRGDRKQAVHWDSFAALLKKKQNGLLI